MTINLDKLLIERAEVHTTSMNALADLVALAKKSPDWRDIQKQAKAGMTERCLRWQIGALLIGLMIPEE